MIQKILGALDIITAVLIGFAENLPREIIAIGGLYLIVKGAVFLLQGDKISLADLTIGIYMIFLSTGNNYMIISIITIAFLAQKGVVSIFS